jgi:hypothetical protein
MIKLYVFIMNKIVYIYDVPKNLQLQNENFDECTRTERVFQKEINKFQRTYDITKADFAFIPIFLASCYYLNNQSQDRFNEAWKSIILAPEEVRLKVKHFVVYSYVLVNVSFECIPKDIKILSYETEVSSINNCGIVCPQLLNNGCGSRMISIPYNLDIQPGYSNAIGNIQHSSYKGLTFEESFIEYSKRPNRIIFVGDIDGCRTNYIKNRSIFVNKIKYHFKDIVIKHPKNEKFAQSYKESKFALILRGDTPTRKAFYTALSMGCIPIIFESGLIHYSDLCIGDISIKDACIIIPDFPSNDPNDSATGSEYFEKVTSVIEAVMDDAEIQRRKLSLIIDIFEKLNYCNTTIDGISNPVYHVINNILGNEKSQPKQPLIYCYNTPHEFHSGLLPVFISPQEIITPDMDNSFGSKINDGLYQTSQYLLEIIWHKKIKNYPYLTSCIEKADIAFIPCYTFLSAWTKQKFVYSCDATIKMINNLISKLPEWSENKYNIPHILVFSDVMWNDVRVYNYHIKMPKGTYTLTLESLPENEIKSGTGNKMITVPYPTEFHFDYNTNKIGVSDHTNRNILLSYLGRSRTIVSELTKLCSNDFNCEILSQPNHYWKSTNNIELTHNMIRIYSTSIFSLQPFGDRGTRRGFYQSLLLGCIPVIFSNNYQSYNGLFQNYIDITKIAVIITSQSVDDIIPFLKSISKEKIYEYQGYAKHCVRNLQYSTFNDPEDAFSITIKTLLKQTT